MSKILFANAHSIFDYTDGASKSIRLILESLVSLGHQVFVVCGSISNGAEGHKYCLNLSKNEESKQINRFILNGIHYSLIKTNSWQRLHLSMSEQELIFRESISIIKNKNIKLIIGWGNLLLEESIFKEAKDNNIKICFYLVSPSYKGKKTYLLQNADFAITDSIATLNLYKSEFDHPIFVIPKFIEHHKKNKLSTNKTNHKYKCLFVNPIIKKGLEPFLLIADYAYKNNMPLEFICINSNNNINHELKLLNYNSTYLPPNIEIRDPVINSFDLFNEINILLIPSLWHESGSRLIYEAYSFSIPVIGFNTGGTPELIGKFTENIFQSPKVYFDTNNILRVYKWNPKDICNRILYLSENYENESSKIESYFKSLNLDSTCNKKLNEIIDFVENS